ncbi:MAG: paraquat-inducible protein A [Gammaproteobacteria bacterium]|nr:paraquat-inducible protein A [Gammaproteobacteria bacterium]
MNTANSLIACQDCDALYRERELAAGESARCVRCDAVLYRARPNAIVNALALTTTAAACYVIANAFPLLGFKLEGRLQENVLLTGVIELWNAGMWSLAALVFLASIGVPALRIVGLLFVLVPLQIGRTAPGLRSALRYLEYLHPWAMVEVYMLGLLVAIVKLSDLAAIVFGTALYAFVALMLALAAADVALEPRDLWRRARAVSQA